MLGMIFETYNGKSMTYDGKSIPSEAWFMLVLSPIILPVLIGAMLVEKTKKDNE